MAIVAAPRDALKCPGFDNSIVTSLNNAGEVLKEALKYKFPINFCPIPIIEVPTNFKKELDRIVDAAKK